MVRRSTLSQSLFPLALVACALLLTGILRETTRPPYGQETRPPYLPKILPNPGIIIYNRVGKCGSRTVLSIFKEGFKT